MTDADRERSAAGGCGRKTPWQAIASRVLADGGVTVERERAYGPDPRHRFDRYVARGGADPLHPPVIFVYGGAWKTGERGCYHFVGTALARLGFEVLIPDYRLFPKVRYPGFIEDVALAYGQACLARRPGQPPPVLIGHSAGAHISALIACDHSYLRALDEGLPKPSALVGISGPYGFDPTTWETTAEIFAPIAGDPDKVRPVAQVPRRMVPTLLMHGGRDAVVTPDASALFHEAIRARGGDATLKVFGRLGHISPVLAMAWPLRWMAPVLADIADFIGGLHSPTGAQSAARSAPPPSGTPPPGGGREPLRTAGS